MCLNIPDVCGGVAGPHHVSECFAVHVSVRVLPDELPVAGPHLVLLQPGVVDQVAQVLSPQSPLAGSPVGAGTAAHVAGSCDGEFLYRRIEN